MSTPNDSTPTDASSTPDSRVGSSDSSAPTYAKDAADLLARWRNGEDVQDALAHKLRSAAAAAESWKASFAKKDADFQEAKRTIAKLTELIMRVDADSWENNVRLDGQKDLVALASQLRASLPNNRDEPRSPEKPLSPER